MLSCLFLAIDLVTRVIVFLDLLDLPSLCVILVVFVIFVCFNLAMNYFINIVNITNITNITNKVYKNIKTVMVQVAKHKLELYPFSAIVRFVEVIFQNPFELNLLKKWIPF